MLVYFYRFLEKIKSSPARKNRVLIIITALGLFINIIIWILIYFRLRPLVMSLPADEAFIPLHYNIYLGVDKFGAWTNIFFLPGLGLIILFLNSLFAVLLYNRKDILSYFLVITNALAQLFLLIATIFIILINI